MIIPHKRILSALVLTTVAGLFTASSVRAQMLDAFTSSDVSNYNFTNTYNPGGTPGSTSDFVASGGVFSPTTPPVNTDVFILKNTADVLNTTGQSVTLTINDRTDSALSGLGLQLNVGTTYNATAGDSEQLILQQNIGSGYQITNVAASYSDAAYTGDPVTLTVTEGAISAGMATYSVLATSTAMGFVPITGSFSFSSVANIGLAIYTPGGQTQAAQGTSFSLVPEPSTYALVGLGALALVFGGRRASRPARHVG
jgi:hypothetical protein